MATLPHPSDPRRVQILRTHQPDFDQGLSDNLFLRRDAVPDPDAKLDLSDNLFFPHREERDKNRSKFRFPYPRKNSDFSKQLYTYLIRTGLSDLNLCVHRYGMLLPKLAELAAHYLEIVYARGPQHVHSGRDSSNVKIIGGISHDHAERVARDAAVFVLDQWDSDYIPRRRREARQGGLTSRRPPKHHHDLLIGLEGLTVAQQAVVLGISVPTISRMRARAKAAATAQSETSVEPVEMAERAWQLSLDDLPADIFDGL